MSDCLRRYHNATHRIFYHSFQPTVQYAWDINNWDAYTLRGNIESQANRPV
ncbi:MAG: hypothetical protein KDK27_13670 [Leptospiraceae bacterium]|nr:hypothetical protein [Leptospiraceae bacterium]